MKDDAQPITAYALKSGSTVTVVGGSTQFPGPPSKEVPTKPTESSILSSIQSELSRVRNSLIPPLDSFTESVTAGKTPREELKQEHTRLGELLLQSLLKLDALTPEIEWEQARMQRKAAVKEVQALLDRLDSTWRSSG
jgi:hypothetical protein